MSLSRARESNVLLYVAGRRVNVVRPAAPASTLTRRPAPGFAL